MIKLTPEFPSVVPDRDRKFNWYLDEPFQIDLEFSNGDKHTIKVDKGYRFNAHSVPFPFDLVFDKASGPDLYCALVHDVLIDFEMVSRLDRATMDGVYRDMMGIEKYQTSKFRSYWMPLGVSLSGYLKHTFWGDHRGDRKKKTVIKIIIKENE